MLLFLFAVIVIFFSEKKNRIFACGTVHYGSDTVQNRFFGGIRYRPFCFLKGNDVLNRTSGKNH